MANFAATVKLMAQAFINNMMQEPEFRVGEFGAFDAFLNDTRFTVPQIAQLKAAEIQPTYFEMLKKVTLPTVTAPSCSITGQVGDSAKTQIDWTFIGKEFTLSQKLHQNNDVAAATYMANQLLDLEKQIFEDLDAAAVLYLETEKSQVNENSDGKGHYAWDNADKSLIIPANEILPTNNYAIAYNWILANMKRNKYNPRFYSIHDVMWLAQWAHAFNQGAGNAVNTQYQFGTNFVPYSSNNIAPADYDKNDLYIVPEGTLAFLHWIDPLNRRGAMENGKEWATWESRLRPGITMQMFTTNDCDDTTSIGGSTQDLVTKYQIGVWYSFQKAPLTNSGESTIFKYVVR